MPVVKNSAKLFSLFLIIALFFSGCQKNFSKKEKPSVKERALYEEYIEQFDFLYDKLKNKEAGTSEELFNIKKEIARINQMDKNLRATLAQKYRVSLKEIDEIIFKVLDANLREKGW